MYQDGRRKKEYLKLYLNGNRIHNQETWRMGEAIRAKRELEVQAEMNGLSANLNRKASFIKYIEKLREESRSKGMRDSWENGLNKFRAFAGDDVKFGNLTRGCSKITRITYLVRSGKTLRRSILQSLRQP